MADYIISTERLGLRRWLDTDIQHFIAMNQDVYVMKYFPALLTQNETIAMIARIRQGFEANGFCLYAVELKATGEFIGFTGFSIPRFESFFTPCVEIGWRYKQSAWGKGYATEAASACLQYGFTTLGLQTVYSFTAAINLPSEKVMQKIGMAKVGEFNHPNIEEDNALCRHVLYKIDNPEL
jgi:ribosomal-protein-alanine N-acetyltransferase